VPEEPWSTGNYLLKVDSKAEDLAGNNFIRLFEEDLSEENTTLPTDFQFINFTVEHSSKRK
jgi:hypothetical protein